MMSYFSQDKSLNFTVGLPSRSSPGANTLTERFPPSLLKQRWQAVSEERIISPEMEPVCLLSSWCASCHFSLLVLHESQCQLQINNRTPKSHFKARPVSRPTVLTSLKSPLPKRKIQAGLVSFFVDVYLNVWVLFSQDPNAFDAIETVLFGENCCTGKMGSLWCLSVRLYGWRCDCFLCYNDFKWDFSESPHPRSIFVFRSV